MPSSERQTRAIERLHASAETVPESVRFVLQRLHAEGHEAYLAGGCVRDVLLGRHCDDYDVATSARPDLVQRAFPKVIPTGVQHGTVTVIAGDGPHDQVEVTTFRGEGEYLDGRRPATVHFLDDIDADLARRDFTVNAIAWDPLRSIVRDPFGGIPDLGRRRIRAVGVARDRFLEDGLRAMRAVRFASVLGFGLDTPTKLAIPETLDVFRRVAMERVRDELVKMLVRSPRPSRGLRLLADTGLMGCFLPELLEGRGVAQNRHHRWDVWEHTLRVVDHAEPSPVVRLAAMLHDVAKPRCAAPVAPGENSFHRHETVGETMASEILERLKCSRKTIEAVSLLVREHLWHYEPAWTDGAIRRRLAKVGAEALPDFFALREADIKGHGVHVREGLANLAALKVRFEAELARSAALSIQDLAIGGGDLMRETGRGPGPWIGETLRALLQHVLDRPEDNERERLLALVRTRPS